MHPRAEIRGLVKDVLAPDGGPYPTDCAERVYTSRFRAWSGVTLPAIGIYTVEEDSETESVGAGGRMRERSMVLAVEIVANPNTDDLDDVLDAIALQVENAIDGDEAKSDANSVLRSGDADVIAIDLESTRIGISEEGSTPVGVCILNWRVMSRSAAAAVADANELQTVQTTWDVDGGDQQPADRVVQTIEIEQEE